MIDLIGKRLVRSLLAEGSFDYQQYGISRSDFEGHAKLLVDFIENFRLEYGKLPNEAQVLENCPVEFTKEPEDSKYVAKILLRNKANARIEEDLRLAAKTLTMDGPEKAYEVIKKMANFDYFPIVDENAHFFVEDGEKRYEEYLESKVTQRGIDWPWPSLTAVTLGLLPSELSVLISPPSTGKSWASIVVASHCLTLGHRVLLVTMEMPGKAFASRFDCVYHKIPFRDIRASDVDAFTEQRWLEDIKTVRTGGEVLILDSHHITYVDDLFPHIEKFKPDVVVVDGGYIFKSRRAGSAWESAADTIKDIQAGCMSTNLPWFVTTQQNLPEKKTLNSNERAKSVRYGKEWWIVANNMIELSQSPEQRDYLKEVTFRILKCREFDGSGGKSEFNCNWDNEFVHFEEQPEGFEHEIEVNF